MALPEGFVLDEQVDTGGQQAPQQVQPPAGFVVEQTAPMSLPSAEDDIVGEALQRGRENIAGRKQELQQTAVDYLRGQIGPREAITQAIGKWGAGNLLDIMGETANASVRGISLLIPDTVEEPMVQSVKDGWHWLTNTKAGEAAIDAASKGVDAWNEYKAGNPQTAKTVESVVNIAAIVTPPKAKVDVKPITKPLEAGASSLEKIAGRQITKKKGAFVEDLLTPQQTKKVRMEQMARTRQEGGILRRNVAQPSPREIGAMQEVMKLDLDPGRSVQYNATLISDANKKLGAKLSARLAGKRNITIDIDGTVKAIDDAVQELVDSNPVIVGNVATTANRAAVKAKELITESGGTPLGLLNARKKFDAYVRNLKGDSVFDPAVDNALSISVRTIRTKMNDVLDAAVPDAEVHKLLKQQSRLYDALDIVNPKAAEEAATSIGRLIQNVARVTKPKAEFNREVALVLGLGAVTAATQMAPYFAGGLAAAGAGAMAYKGITSPQVKKALSGLLKQTSKAINATQSPEMLKQLRADRAVLIELMQNIDVSEDKEEER